jgi:hypothetical protein
MKQDIRRGMETVGKAPAGSAKTHRQFRKCPFSAVSVLFCAVFQPGALAAKRRAKPVWISPWGDVEKDYGAK